MKAYKEFKINGDGLIPIIVQQFDSKEVLMQAYMNQESYKKTLETGKLYFYSRSRKGLWLKGETSGHTQVLKGLYTDCDKDCFLALVDQKGVACHTGEYSCFYTKILG